MNAAAQPPALFAEPGAGQAATFTLALAGDVMIGRGIDQALPEPSPPQLFEPWVDDARQYLRLAECAHGAITLPVALGYPWGDALRTAAWQAADLRIVNLETALTTAGTPWAGKRIHYRANPAHVGCLRAAGVDACVVANNHLLDWGVAGLLDTIAALREAGIASTGAGATQSEAEAPAVLPLRGGTRVLLFAWATASSGVPDDWSALGGRPGVAYLPRLDDDAVQTVAESVRRHRRDGDRVIVSLHWGANWVDAVPVAHRRFAHRLIDIDAADVVHGHSSHHPLPIEVYKDKLILYGCGDLINDYEGITSRERQRSDLVCLYAATLSRRDGRLQALRPVPFQLRRLRLTQPDAQARSELRTMFDAGGREFGTRLRADGDEGWCLQWHPARPSTEPTA